MKQVASKPECGPEISYYFEFVTFKIHMNNIHKDQPSFIPKFLKFYNYKIYLILFFMVILLLSNQ
jgi:hypothetical protein